MKQRFLNQKLGKRTSHRAELLKAGKAISPAGTWRRARNPETPRKPPRHA